MKKILFLLLVAVLLVNTVLPVMATDKPQITLQPQNYSYAENDVATYTVKATGKNLSCTWYMNYMNHTYTISNTSGAMQPWEIFAGETYGAQKIDNNTFSYVFSGIGAELDGAEIWCVIKNSGGEVTSQRVIISVVSGDVKPPEITNIPSNITVNRGDNAEIRCVARSKDGSQLGYLWYETSTGKLQDIRAIMPDENSDFLIPDTEEVGTRYYVCCVSTSNGGSAYSSVVAVTVVDKPAVEPPEISTTSLPEATAGEEYSFTIKGSDKNAHYTIHYNPGKANDFEKTGLTLSKNGKISGVPKAPGKYGFAVCASNEGGEDYAVFTLTVKEAPVVTETPAPTEVITAVPEETPILTEVPEETPILTEVPEETPTITEAPEETHEILPEATEEPPVIEENNSPPKDDGGVNWLVIAIIAVGVAIVSAIITTIILKKKANK